MSRPTRNCRDTVLLPEVAPAGLPDVSVQSSHPATSINSAVTSVASPLTAAQLSPDCLAAIVQVVRASIAAEGPHVLLSQSSSSPASVAVAGASCSSLPVPGGVPGLDLGAQASALLASGTGFSQPPSLSSTSCSQGRPAFVVPSFVCAPKSFACVVSCKFSCRLSPAVWCADFVRCLSSTNSSPTICGRPGILADPGENRHPDCVWKICGV